MKATKASPPRRFGRLFALVPLQVSVDGGADRGTAPFSRSPTGRVPYLSRPAAGARPHDAPRQTTLGEPPQRAPELICATMSTEQIADIGAGHAVIAGLAQRPQDLVSDWIAQRIAPDIAGRGLGIFPDRQRSAQMLDVDLGPAVEQRV